MNLDDLQRRIDTWKSRMASEDSEPLESDLANLLSAYPFSEYEYAISRLLSDDVITFEEYENLRDEYVNANKNLPLFNLAQRIFGQIWGEAHLRSLDTRFSKPSKQLDPDYVGEYDLYLEGIKIEIKAARAIDTNKRGDLASKALNTGSDGSFWMNFQQLKTGVADIFVFIGVWTDDIRYWVLTEREAESNPFWSHQHRGGVEYQIGIRDTNIDQFEQYAEAPEGIATVILTKAGL